MEPFNIHDFNANPLPLYPFEFQFWSYSYSTYATDDGYVLKLNARTLFIN